VHALAQVASAHVTFTHNAGTLTRALNAHLPADIRVVAVEDAVEGFHARFSARGKTYRYQVRNTSVADPFDRSFAWHLPEPLSLDAMTRAASLLVGTHDFIAFRSAGSEIASSVRTVTRSEWHQA
jgi:tRNA pseudouridine38-40 synthase